MQGWGRKPLARRHSERFPTPIQAESCQWQGQEGVQLCQDPKVVVGTSGAAAVPMASRVNGYLEPFISDERSVVNYFSSSSSFLASAAEAVPGHFSTISCSSRFASFGLDLTKSLAP